MSNERVFRKFGEALFLLMTLLALIISQTGCASLGKKLKAFVGGKPDVARENLGPRQPSFSSQPNLGLRGERQYKRVTKENFADNQGLEAGEGSLWRKEGQGAFLFAQNNLRNMGDIVTVKIEDKTAQDLSVKAEIIKSMQQALMPKPKRHRPASVVGSIPKPEKDEKEMDAEGKDKELASKETEKAKEKDKEGRIKDPGKKVAGKVNERPDFERDFRSGEIEKKEEAFKFDVAEVPTRIVDRFSDGSYRIKGVQSFMIGKKEYKVLVTGVVKPEDINSDVVSSMRLLDGKFDLVATNKEKRPNEYQLR